MTGTSTPITAAEDRDDAIVSQLHHLAAEPRTNRLGPIGHQAVAGCLEILRGRGLGYVAQRYLDQLHGQALEEDEARGHAAWDAYWTGADDTEDAR